MKAARQAAWLFCILIVLAGSGWYFASSASITKLDDKTLSTTADNIITQLNVRQFSANGQLVNQLQTPLMKHIPHNNVRWFKTPRLLLTQPNQSVWEISAKQATALYGGEQITFTHHVIIHQNKNEHSPESTLKTEKITYFPKKKLAHTTESVTFEQPGIQVTAIGMKAYLEEKRVKLLHQVRGTYAPGQD